MNGVILCELSSLREAPSLSPTSLYQAVNKARFMLHAIIDRNGTLVKHSLSQLRPFLDNFAEIPHSMFQTRASDLPTPDISNPDSDTTIEILATETVKHYDCSITW